MSGGDVLDESEHPHLPLTQGRFLCAAGTGQSTEAGDDIKMVIFLLFFV